MLGSWRYARRMRQLALLIVALLALSTQAEAQNTSTVTVRFVQLESPLLRSPRPDAEVFTTFPCGEAVALIESAIGAPYVHVVVHERHGYMLAENISSNAAPECARNASPSLPSTELSASTIELAQALLADLSRGEAEYGPCRCPTDLARDGRRCGLRSAYSRQGGQTPEKCL